MEMDTDLGFQSLTKTIIRAALDVSNSLGCGFLEVVYKNALYEELLFRELSVQKERSFEVFYREKRVGFYVADLVVQNCIIIELKTVAALTQVHQSELVNYLRASNIPVGLLMNFGLPRLAWKRIAA